MGPYWTLSTQGTVAGDAIASFERRSIRRIADLLTACPTSVRAR